MKVFTILSAILIFMSFGLPQKKKYKVENVRIESCASNCKEVKGMIRNISSEPIKGTVKIKFLDVNGDIVKSVRAYVNDGDPIQPKQAGSFSYADSPSEFSGVKSFDVIFVEG